MSGSPKTVYFREEEIAAIKESADYLDSSESFVIRAAVRILVGLPVGKSVREAAEQLRTKADQGTS